MKLLFVHQNFPGQYKHLAPALAANPANQVMALTMNEPPRIPGINIVRYGIANKPTPGLHPYVVEHESKILRAEGAARAALQLREKGFVPDVICAHPGWGEALFLKDIFPQAKLLSFFEFYYHAKGADVGFDPEYPCDDLDQIFRLRVKNTANLLSLEASDWGVSPTAWQRAQFPPEYQSKISVIHDGIDTERICPRPDIALTLNDKVRLTRADEVITFVNRNLEPYRGYHSFMRALPEILQRRPHARVLIVGGDEVSYGKVPEDGISYKQKYLTELEGKLDLSRLHFLGKIPYAQFLALLQLSSVHVYLTYPFVLSWSMIEAMSAGCLVVGSATPPVQEVIEDGVNGLLVDFFSSAQLADTVCRVLDHPDRMQALREKARRKAMECYDLKRVCLPAHIRLIEKLAAGGVVV